MRITDIQLNRRSAQAFTLIEVLVASVVMVVLVGLVAYIAGSVMSSWNRSSGKLAANAEARLVMNMIAQDLETAVLRNNGQQWLRVEGPVLVLDADPDPPEVPYPAPPYISNSVLLKLFAPVPDSGSGDGVCAIGYALAYTSHYTTGHITYGLYRRVISPQDTFNNYLSSGFEDPASSAQGILSGNTPDWSDSDITDNDNYLAGNIVDFKVLIYELDAATNTSRLVNGNASNEVTRDYAYGGVNVVGGDEVSWAQPLYADIILTIVTDEGAEMLKTFRASATTPRRRVIDLIPEDGDDVVAQHGETLIRRVYFKSNSI